MKTVRVKIYKFEELDLAAQQFAIEQRRKTVDNFHIYDEGEKSVDAFNEILNLENGRNSWLEYRHNFKDEVANLRGVRLLAYIENNFDELLRERKYRRQMKSETPIYHKCVIVRRRCGTIRNVFKSNMFFENSCLLTGVWCDDYLTEPFIKFTQNPCEQTTLIDLIDEAFENMRSGLENASDYLYSDEAITEDLINNDLDYLKSGREYYQ